MHIFLGARRRKKQRKKHKDHKCAWLSALHWRRWCNVASEKTFKNHTRLNGIWELLVKRWYFFFFVHRGDVQSVSQTTCCFLLFFFFFTDNLLQQHQIISCILKNRGHGSCECGGGRCIVVNGAGLLLATTALLADSSEQASYELTCLQHIRTYRRCVPGSVA